MKAVTEIFKTLGDPTRIRILNLLLKAKKELCVCELVDSLEIPQYNVSRHLKELEGVNLISSRKEGRWVYYSLYKNKEVFQKKLLETFSTISNDQFFSKDLINLKKRFEIRENGKCVTGVKKKLLGRREKIL